MDSLSNKKTGGFLMIDVMIGLVVATLVSGAFMSSVVHAVRYSAEHNRALQAEFLVVELTEIARELESSDWSTLADGHCATTPCHPEVSGGTWSLVANTDMVRGFTRGITTEEVKRDSDFAVDASGTVDPKSRKIIATVTWYTQGEPKQITLETYVYDHS